LFGSTAAAVFPLYFQRSQGVGIATLIFRYFLRYFVFDPPNRFVHHNRIATKLNERNVKTARGGTWTHVQVGAILRPFEASVAESGTTAATRRYSAIQGREGGSEPMTIEHGDTPMSRVEYDGDNPLRLANEIEAALVKYGVGNDHRMCKAIHFFEGELRLIAECLRCAGPQKVAKRPRNSTRRVATR
jgi:hypothetical protein